MPGMPSRALVMVGLIMSALVLVAKAQTPATSQEDVTVTATKSREAIDKFAKAFETPARPGGKIARWENGLCPAAMGQPAALTAFITARVKAVAAAVAAPVSTLSPCTPNIEIIFTTTPQSLLDNVREHNPDYLGYAESSDARDKIAVMTRAVQAWYLTETVDFNGARKIDTARRPGDGVTISNFSASAMPSTSATSRDPINLSEATFARVTGSRINEGTRSGFNHILIVIDSKKLVGRDFVPLADYIAMLALTELNSLDACQQMPSIVNLLAAGCERQVNGLTQGDMGYLHAIYGMGAGKSLITQQNDIADAMMKDMLGR